MLAFEHDGFDVRVPSDIAEIYGAPPGAGARDPVQADLLVLANTEIVASPAAPAIT